MTAPVSPYPLALFRILFGFILLLNGAFLLPDIHTWFSRDGIFSLNLARSMIGPDRLNIFLLTSDAPLTVSFVFWSYMAACFGLMIGFAARKMALIVFICLASFAHRNIYILHSGDTFIRLISFMFIFAPSAAALSIESMVYGGPRKSINPTAFRVMQLQICLLYFAAALFKLKGDKWMDGSVVYIVQQLREFQRFPVPDFMRTVAASKLQTWGTLAVEGLFPFLVWFRDTRLLVMAALVLMHLGIEYSMNIQLFEWTLIAATTLFLTEGEIKGILWRKNPESA
jgi:hypothetical protein